MINIYTQSTQMPANLDGETPPSIETLRRHGWREEPPIPPVDEGYTRVGIRLVEGDGVMGQWWCYDRPTADIEAEAAQAEAARQAAKPAALKAVENSFLLFCQQLTGQRVKAGFSQLKQIIGAMAANPETTAQALVIAAQLTAINDEGFREGGLQWWDDITWHEEIAQ